MGYYKTETSWWLALIAFIAGLMVAFHMGKIPPWLLSVTVNGFGGWHGGIGFLAIVISMGVLLIRFIPDPRSIR